VTHDAITLRRPDDWHVHLRDGEMLRAVVRHTAESFGRAVVMPNLIPPITTAEAALAYRARILAALPADSTFEPLMTCYLTNDSDPDEIARGHREGTFFAAKLYPAHATTNSQAGVTDVANIDRTLERMQAIDMPLLIHGEATSADVDVFDRERVFIEETLTSLLSRYPALRVVLEHVTTADAVEFVKSNGGRLGATITPHHLIINRNALFAGGLRPHHYCLPVAKRERHRQALRRAATSGDERFFLGTDSAPHATSAKEGACACAGIFNAPVALAAYARVFEEEHALDRFEAFASLNGPRFYGLPPNDETIVLHRKERLTVPDEIRAGQECVRPFLAGEDIAWSYQASGVQSRYA
jgi:dihydroorotase